MKAPAWKMLTLPVLLSATLALEARATREVFVCDLEVRNSGHTLKVENLMARPGQLHLENPPSPSSEETYIIYRLPDRISSVPGAEATCLSLWAQEDEGMTEEDARSRLLPIGEGKYLDVCWEMFKGVKNSALRIPGFLAVYLGSRSVENESGRLSQRESDIDQKRPLIQKGPGSNSREIPELGEIQLNCRTETR